jgi:hypothetical protein
MSWRHIDRAPDGGLARNSIGIIDRVGRADATIERGVGVERAGEAFDRMRMKPACKHDVVPGRHRIEWLGSPEVLRTELVASTGGASETVPAIDGRSRPNVRREDVTVCRDRADLIPARRVYERPGLSLAPLIPTIELVSRKAPSDIRDDARQRPARKPNASVGTHGGMDGRRRSGSPDGTPEWARLAPRRHPRRLKASPRIVPLRATAMARRRVSSGCHSKTP